MFRELYSKVDNNITCVDTSSNGFLGTIPAGTKLISIEVEEKGGANVTVSFGTTALGTDISMLMFIKANEDTPVEVNYKTRTGFGVYVSSAAWGTSVLDIYLVTKKIH